MIATEQNATPKDWSLYTDTQRLISTEAQRDTWIDGEAAREMNDLRTIVGEFDSHMEKIRNSSQPRSSRRSDSPPTKGPARA